MLKDYIYFTIPSLETINEAHELIKPYIHHTPILSSEQLNKIADCTVFFKCENMQKVGAFKSRGAVNAVFSLSPSQLVNGVCTHSSGNHAQALARAASLKGIPSYIVMPENAPKVKVEAVRAYGGIITFCEPTLQARESTIAEVIERTKATEIHPYDNLKVIEGQATAAKEIFEELQDIEIITVPVGGGGLLSGTALATKYFSPKTKVIAAEPKNADDAYQTFVSRKFVPSVKPNTIADGLLTSLGKYSFPIILKYVNQIITVDEESIIEAMKLIYQRLKIIIEPSSAVPFAAVLKNHEIFKNKRVAIILSGGNVDLELLKKIF
ncbi:MAG: serine dehydratase [Bacteroidetes bacterium CG2_30_33_31]|nr:MAG: serine dehydratase [Bacteroidetes bacterium CG2_30_33_31]